MTTRIFRDKIRHIVEVYIDDMVGKSKKKQGHIDDLRDMFEVLLRHKLCLNADKCAFRVGAGKFLGYMITHQGIEVNSNQIKVVECLKLPSNPKEVQVLTNMLADVHEIYTIKYHQICIVSLPFILFCD